MSSSKRTTYLKEIYESQLRWEKVLTLTIRVVKARGDQDRVENGRAGIKVEDGRNPSVG